MYHIGKGKKHARHESLEPFGMCLSLSQVDGLLPSELQKALYMREFRQDVRLADWAHEKLSDDYKYQEAIAAFETAITLSPSFYTKANDNLKIARHAQATARPLTLSPAAAPYVNNPGMQR
jgi:hypothetical protein